VQSKGQDSVVEQALSLRLDLAAASEPVVVLGQTQAQLEEALEFEREPQKYLEEEGALGAWVQAQEQQPGAVDEPVRV